MVQATLSFQDVIKKSVLEAGSFLTALTPDTLARVVLYLLIATLLGILLYVIYKKWYAGVVYSQSFAVSLAGMTVLTCAVILAIQSNVVLSLGMVGALSIVRYRTAVKDPMDLLFLFWAVALGVSVGAGMIVIAALVMVIMPLMLALLMRGKGAQDELYILLIHYDNDQVELRVRRILGKLRYQIKSKTLRGADIEMAIEVRARNFNTMFVEEIRNVAGVRDVTLVQYGGDYVG